jgi:hypothetical protein
VGKMKKRDHLEEAERQEDKNTANVEETEWEVVDWNNVALDTDQWLTLEKTKIIIWDP